jgi:hypothetical protein
MAYAGGAYPARAAARHGHGLAALHGRAPMLRKATARNASDRRPLFLGKADGQVFAVATTDPKRKLHPERSAVLNPTTITGVLSLVPKNGAFSSAIFSFFSSVIRRGNRE